MNAKYYRTICFLRQCAVMKRRFTLPIKLIKSKFWKSESYYPELPNHKSRFRIFCELMGHIWKYGSIEWHYFSYGFDVKGFRNRAEYLDDSYWFWNTNVQNTILGDWDYTCILRDKVLFSQFVNLWGFQAPKIVMSTNANNANLFVNKLFARRGGISVNH